ncbi:PilN domain-containing protein [Chloroflexota bacterium]
MANKVTTLYINDTSIRLMVNRGKRIIKLADASLDMNLADTSANVREAEVVAKIKQLLKANRITTKKVVVGLSGLHCLTRPAVLPELPRAMMHEAVIREARRVLPVPSEQLYISWQLMSVAEGKTQVLIVAIPRQIADNLLQILNQVGLKPYLMEIKPLALVRLVQEATAIVVDVQSREFDIVIVADGIPQPIRSVPFPEETLSLPDKLSMVKDELKRTVKFYNSNNPERPIQPDVAVYASGELSDESESESLASELGYRVLPLSSPLKCPKQLDPAHYLVNIGLALKELPKEAGPLLPNLNSLPDSYLPKPISLKKIAALPAAAVAVGLVVVMAMTIQDAAANISSVQSQLDTADTILEQRSTQKNKLVENIAALEAEVAGAETKRNAFASAIENLDKIEERINGDLEAIMDNLVDGVGLGNVSHSGGNVNINGQAPSEVEILRYARNLDLTERFSEVTISYLTRTEGSDNETDMTQFSMSLSIMEEAE